MNRAGAHRDVTEHRDIIDISWPEKAKRLETEPRWAEVALALVVFAAGLTLIWLLG